MNLVFVSSMNIKLYEEYGKRFIYEFIDKASEDINLIIMFEGISPNEILNLKKNLVVKSLDNEKHNKFIKFFGHLHEARGLRVKFFEENGVKKINVLSNYKYDAIRFSFKPFSILQVLKYVPKASDYLIWTDADLRCKKNFNADSIIKFLPEKDELMSYLGREKNYSECGFLGFNLLHTEFKNFINRMTDIYSTGEIFSLNEWHDSWVWDYVRKEFEDRKIKFRNISNKGFSHYHPFINSGLEEYFDHLKGPTRKKEGKSRDEDYIK